MATGTIKQTGATTGASVYNSTYFDTPLINYYRKYGQVVHCVFLASLKAEVPNGTAIIYGLPKLYGNYFPTPYLFSSNQYMSTPTYGYGGTFSSQTISSYAIPSSYVGKFLYLNFTYISAE